MDQAEQLVPPGDIIIAGGEVIAGGATLAPGRYRYPGTDQYLEVGLGDPDLDLDEDAPTTSGA